MCTLFCEPVHIFLQVVNQNLRHFTINNKKIILQALEMSALASIYGGKVLVHLDKSQQLVPDKSVYRVRFTISPVEDVKVEQCVV